MDHTLDNLVQIDYPESWADATGKAFADEDLPEFVKNVMNPMIAAQGDKLPVSSFSVDGIFPVGTTQYEKRGVAINVPEWDIDNCIQCNSVRYGLSACGHSAFPGDRCGTGSCPGGF